MATNSVFLLLSFTAAGSVQGTLGFGFAVASTLLLVNNTDFTTLVFLNLCMTLLTCFISMLSLQNLRSIQKLVLIKLVVSALTGLGVGIVLVNYLNAFILKQCTLLIILLASVLSLGNNKSFFSHKYMSLAGGFLSGVLTPSTAINGPLVMLHLNAALKNKQEIRTTMLSYLMIIMAFGIVSMDFKLELPSGIWRTVVQIILPTLAGYTLGVITFRLLPDNVYKRIVLLFLIASSFLSLLYLFYK